MAGALSLMKMVNGVLRPRTNSAGRLIHPTDRGIDNFWRGYKDSKLVDADGRPIEMVHVAKPRPSREGEAISKFNPAFGEFGIHFGPSAQGNQLADISSFSVPAYLNLKKPVRMRDHGSWGAQMLGDLPLPDATLGTFIHSGVGPLEWAKLRKELQRTGGGDSVVYLNRREGISEGDKLAAEERYPDMYPEDWDYEVTDQQFREVFPSASDAYIVFRPDQIKSAVGNNGDFDWGRTLIHKAQGGLASYHQGGH